MREKRERIQKMKQTIEREGRGRGGRGRGGREEEEEEEKEKEKRKRRRERYQGLHHVQIVFGGGPMQREAHLEVPHVDVHLLIAHKPL